jgi:membrane associated rhomboid family serine protease
MREPALNIPAIIVLYASFLLLVFLWQNQLQTTAHMDIMMRYGFVPARLSIILNTDSLNDILNNINMIYDRRERQTNLTLAWQALGLNPLGIKQNADGISVVTTTVSYAFLHGSWSHVIMNTLWIVVFGTPVARRLGMVRILILIVLTAIAGAFAHWAFNRFELIPMIGASAVASGFTAAAIRFALGRPTDHGVFLSHTHAPLLSLRDLIAHRQAFAFIMVWLIMNFAFGILSQPLGLTDSPVAWEAHLGGFIMGFVLIQILDKTHTA